MRDAGEPLSRDLVDRRATEIRALSNALLGVALFSGAVLINGIVAILFIALMQALGMWGPATAEAASVEMFDEARSSLQAVAHRSQAPILDG